MEDQPKYKTKRPAKDSFLEHGKLPPQAIDIEEAVLGALMLEKHALQEVINRITPDVFYREAHQAIYTAILSLYDNNNPVDVLTVASQLRTEGKLELAGGPFYITQLTSRVASSANIEHHSTILLQKYIARELIKLSTDISRSAFDDENDVFDLLDQADAQFSRVNEISIRGGSMLHISDASTKAFDELKRREITYKEGKATGVPTGLHDFDKLTGGWQKTFLNIIAARPGMGKTALMLHFVKSAAKAKFHACIYTLEMSDISLANRMLLSMSSVDVDRFKKGSVNQQDWSDLSLAKSELDKLPIYIDPNPSVTIRYIKSNSRLQKKKGKCDIIFIDYLQLVDMSTGEKNRNRENEVAQASRQCKIIAKELNIPVVLLCQLSRKVEERKGNRPELQDLRESGAIEQDADLVTFIYRPEYYGIENFGNGNKTEGIGELINAKHRDGSTDDIFFRYNTEMTKIGDYETMESIQFPNTPRF